MIRIHIDTKLAEVTYMLITVFMIFSCREVILLWPGRSKKSPEHL